MKYVLDIENDTNIQFIKQRSPEWFQIRKQARITGSTLNSGIGLDTLQKQKQHFYDVEKYMRDNNFTETAHFIKLVRNWHDACNHRGLSADTRVKFLFEMHEFLTRGINFNAVPSQFPGRYVRGLTWQTFEAILQTISTHIQLYYFSNDATYNSRAVSTLANKSFLQT